LFLEEGEKSRNSARSTVRGWDRREGGRGGEGAHQISSQTRPKKKAEAQPHTKLPTHFIEDLEKTPRNFSREFIIFPVKNGGERPEAIQRNTKATVLPCLQRNLKHPLNQLS
jgi:hypothetical protein